MLLPHVCRGLAPLHRTASKIVLDTAMSSISHKRLHDATCISYVWLRYIKRLVNEKLIVLPSGINTASLAAGKRSIFSSKNGPQTRASSGFLVVWLEHPFIGT